MVTDDLELGLPRQSQPTTRHVPQSGYPALGDWIAQDQDSETFIFRRFSRLSARNLLFLQNRVYELEAESDRLDGELLHADVELRKSVRKYEDLMSRAAEQPDGPEARRVALSKEINTTLKDYYEALALYSNIIELAKPRKYQLQTCRDWFKSATGKFSVISGKAKTMLDDEDDLVSLRVPSEKDFLTQFVQRHWMFSRPKETMIQGNTRYFDRKRVTQTVAMITTIIVALEIIAPVISLYFVKSSGARLGMICGFTVLFALSLSYLSSAKRGEIFGASAAYAAVLVVFVQGELGQR